MPIIICFKYVPLVIKKNPVISKQPKRNKPINNIMCSVLIISNKYMTFTMFCCFCCSYTSVNTLKYALLDNSDNNSKALHP